MTEDVGRDPTPFELSVEGHRVSGLDWGGDGTPLVLLHANGFCAGMYDPIARRLAGADFHPVGVDLRGHGRTDPPATPAEFAFQSVAIELAGALSQVGIARAFVVGASFGGGVAVWLNALFPGLVAHAILAEAIAFDQQALSDIANPMAEQTRRRRVNWPNRDEIATSYGSRPPLDALEPAALRAYLRYGTLDQPDGSVNLACDPAVEAGYYERAATIDGGRGAAGELGKLAGHATVLCGQHSNLGPNRFRRQAELAGAGFVALDAGHLVLHEDTVRAIDLIQEHARDHQAPPSAEGSRRP
jgi:pimeloyl-ACP methyl ester carboxylesterase